LANSPDLAAARKVAKFLDTVHHEFVYTIQQGLDALSDVIYHIETYDVTTIRASTPMYLLSRRIKAMGVKMVLSGEGADEVFGGYLYGSQRERERERERERARREREREREYGSICVAWLELLSLT
jgi:asparagine synthase (glutamine-hydrolysing)